MPKQRVMRAGPAGGWHKECWTPCEQTVPYQTCRRKKMDRTISDIQNERLNDLYWSSSRTVDEIVEELGVGRNTLYASVRPFPAGEICRTCGNQIVFTNRTSRASGVGVCEGCGLETTIGEDAPLAHASSSRGNPYGGARWDQWRDEVASVAPARAALIGSAAVLGILVGAVAVRAIRD